MGDYTDGKIDSGKISSNDMITEKEGYEAMLYMLYRIWKEINWNDVTDILSAGEYWLGEDMPADIDFWYRWLEAVDKMKDPDR